MGERVPGRRRSGQGMTELQRDEAVGIIESLLGRGTHKHQIFAVFKRPWGQGNYAPLSARTCGALLTRAKGNLRAAVVAGAGRDDPRRAARSCRRGSSADAGRRGRRRPRPPPAGCPLRASGAPRRSGR